MTRFFPAVFEPTAFISEAEIDFFPFHAMIRLLLLISYTFNSGVYLGKGAQNEEGHRHARYFSRRGSEGEYAFYPFSDYVWLRMRLSTHLHLFSFSKTHPALHFGHPLGDPWRNIPGMQRGVRTFPSNMVTIGKAVMKF